MRKKIVLEGEGVNGIEYRIFLFELAESCNLRGLYVKDAGRNVEVFVDGEVLDVRKFISEIEEAKSAKVVKVEDYLGGVIKLESFYRILVLHQLTRIFNAIKEGG